MATSPVKIRISFISWRKNIPRSRNLSRILGAKDHYIEFLPDAPRLLLPLRYLVQAIRTFQILRRDRPDLILAMNPPIVLPLICHLYCKIFGGKLIIDSHTGALIGEWSRFISLHRFLSRKAMLTIVTNRPLREMIESWGAPGLVLEDVLPDLPKTAFSESGNRPAICVINSFSDDEPLDEILTAAEMLPEHDFHITGRLPGGSAALFSRKPANVHFTGYLPDVDYARLLNASDIIMVLVKTDYTMLCGAYEAVAVEKPLITSDWKVLRDYFRKGTLYVDNSPEEIRRAVGEAFARKAELSSEMKELKWSIREQWSAHFDVLINRLDRKSENYSPAPSFDGVTGIRIPYCEKALYPAGQCFCRNERSCFYRARARNRNRVLKVRLRVRLRARARILKHEFIGSRDFAFDVIPADAGKV